MAASSSSAAAVAAAPIISAERKVVAFIGDEDGVATLRAGLESLADNLDVRRGGLRHAIRFFRTLVPVSACVIDISGEPDPRAELAELAQVCPPEVLVFLVGDNTGIDFYRLLIHELGATDYLPKPLTRDSVQRLLLPRLVGTAVELADFRRGHLVLVCGARGGVGASTIAVNVALQLANSVQGQSVLLDLHLHDGTTAMMLSAKPGPGLRIALESPDRSDGLFIERATLTVESRLRLIAADDASDTAPSITAAGVDQVVELLRQKFNFIVADLPTPIPESVRRLLTVARHVVVVTHPDLPGLRDAKVLRQSVMLAAGTDRAITVLNRANQRGGLSKELVERGLGKPPEVVVPDLGAKMLEAVNLGLPAVQRVPALRRHLQPIVREIASVNTEQAPRRKFMRLFRR
jgi:pilus assembly protein CpaE